MVFNANALNCCFTPLLQISMHSPQTPSCFCQFCNHLSAIPIWEESIGLYNIYNDHFTGSVPTSIISRTVSTLLFALQVAITSA